VGWTKCNQLFLKQKNGGEETGKTGEETKSDSGEYSGHSSEVFGQKPFTMRHRD